MSAAELFLAHLLAAHLAVPEPVRLEIISGPLGFERSSYSLTYDAYIQRDPLSTTIERGWLIRYDRLAFGSSTRARVRFVLAHELCHAISDYTVNWEGLTLGEQRARHRVVDDCARRALRQHSETCGGDR